MKELLYYTNLQIENLPNEIWVDAFGFDGIYSVSNKGRIKSEGRYVSNGKSERWVKERILKQYLPKHDNRLHCIFSVSNIHYYLNIPLLIFQSFNPSKSWDSNTIHVAHKNRNTLDNRIKNLILLSIRDVRMLDIDRISNNLSDMRIKKIEKYNLLETKICIRCSIEKPVNEFRGFECIECLKKRKANYYSNKLKSKGKEKRNVKCITITDTVTGDIFTSKNKNKCVVSREVINKYANTGELVYPYRNSNHKNPLLITII